MCKLFHLVIIIFLTMIAISFELYSQSSFIFKYSTLSDEWPMDAIETDDGGFIIAAGIGTYTPNLYRTLLLKIDSSGDTVLTKTIALNEGTCLIGDLLKSVDGNFFGIGKQELPGEDKLWLLKISPELDIIIDTVYSIGAMDILMFNGMVDQFSNLIIYGSASGVDQYNHPYLYKLNQTGDSLSYKYYNDSLGSEYSYSVIEKPDSTGYYMIILGDYQINLNTSGQILTINYNLDVTGIDSMPGGYALYYNAKVLNDHQFIITGKRITSYSPRTDKLGIEKLDTTFIVENSFLMGPSDTISYPAYGCNLDFIDSNVIYYGGTCNQSIGTPFSNKNSFYLLGGFDASLNLKWQKYYGGDQYYSLRGITATSDGGCLLVGSSFNYQTQTNERDIYIIKVDSNGVITSTDETRQAAMHDAIVYPNPGKDYLVIESGPQVTGAKMTMTDMNGRQVLSETLYGSHITINTQLLHSGTYLWQIILRNKVIEAGKWIKY